VDLYLSTDGGNSWQLQQPRLTGGEYRIIVPHTPSKFTRAKLERAVPYSVSATPGLFTIETSVSLLTFAAALAPEGGIELSWRTDPGPEDLAGYRLERADARADWRTLVSLTRATRYADAAGAPGSRYRLFSINGLGQELLLGEAALLPARPLAAWPLPYRGGELTVSFATASAPGGGMAPAEVVMFDLRGRLVRTITRGAFGAGYESAHWDGRDAEGRSVPAGIYFLRARTGASQAQLKVVVMP
jgi:hypothetical protein